MIKYMDTLSNLWQIVVIIFISIGSSTSSSNIHIYSINQNILLLHYILC